MGGELQLTLDDTEHTLSSGGYAYVAPATRWTVANAGDAPVFFHWIRKAYQPLEGLDAPRLLRGFRPRRRPGVDAGHGRRLGDDAFRGW